MPGVASPVRHTVAQRIQCADVFNAIFSTGPAVALIITLVLDNLVPGTREERGLHVWQQVYKNSENWWDDDYANRVRGQIPVHCSV